MQCRNSRLGTTLIIELVGQLDGTTGPAFEDHCRQSVLLGDQTVVLDLASLEYISSAGLRSILTVAKQLKKQGGVIMISRAHGVVRDVLEVSGLSTVFRFVDAPSDAHQPA
jgi:anti-anti-sigma factor